MLSSSLTKSLALGRWIPVVVIALALTPAKAVPSAAREWNEQLLAAIRLNVPNPPAHARNLFHVAVAMYDAWAAYDPTPTGYITNEKVTPLPPDVEAARAEAISFAAYRVLRNRFGNTVGSLGVGNATSLTNFDNKINALYGAGSSTNGQAAVTAGTTPMEVGRRIGQAIVAWGANDGFPIPNPDLPGSFTAVNIANRDYPQPYDTSVNPNFSPTLAIVSNMAMSVLGNNGEFPTRTNMPLGVGLPSTMDPNFWQPLALSANVDQGGNATPGGIQGFITRVSDSTTQYLGFIGVQCLRATPFALTRVDNTKPWLDPYGGPSKISFNGTISPTDAAYKAQALSVIRASRELNDVVGIDISPGAYGNNSLGADGGSGRPLNPVTNTPYAPNVVNKGDFVRVLAEFWADGPKSETPPGHWHVLANEVADNPLTVKKIRGVGPTVNDLEWDIKTYFSVASATHDAACCAWSLKRYYSGPRPIGLIRYMGSKGQSSDPMGLSYHAEGLPLETDLVEVVTLATYAPGGKHEQIWNMYTNTYDAGFFHEGEVVVKSWPAENYLNLPAPSIATHPSTVRWMLAKDWVPFQRKTFNTPAFPGYVSGHSTFSRSAAEVLTLLTGSPYFPGGFGHHTVAANSMQIDLGPSTDVDLQWCTFFDASDQAGQSRRWGGIHVSEDDYHGRVIGSQAGIGAFTLAEKYWTGTITSDLITPDITVLSPTSVKVTWNTIRGMYYKVRTSTTLTGWTDVAPLALTYNTVGSYIDTNATPEKKFYQVVRSTAP